MGSTSEDLRVHQCTKVDMPATKSPGKQPSGERDVGLKRINIVKSTQNIESGMMRAFLSSDIGEPSWKKPDNHATNDVKHFNSQIFWKYCHAYAT